MDMSRCVFLPSMGDPFLIRLSFNHMKKWLDIVDRVYIYINTPLPKYIVEDEMNYIRHPKVTVYYADHFIDHGPAIAYMLNRASEDIVMLMEEDAFVLNPEYVDEQFREIEAGFYDVVGSRRGSTTQPVIEKMSRVFGVDSSWRNGGGAAWWPCFLFTKRERLLATDLNFGSKQWNTGDYIKELDYTVAETTPADTFVWASIQLMAQNLSMKDIKQYHVNPHWYSDLREKANVFSLDCPWIHVGSLSGGITGLLKASNGFPLATYQNEGGAIPYSQPIRPQTEDEKYELQRRLAFYRMAYELYEKDTEPIKGFSLEYVGAINRASAYFQTDNGDVEAQKNTFKKLLSI